MQSRLININTGCITFSGKETKVNMEKITDSISLFLEWRLSVKGTLLAAVFLMILIPFLKSFLMIFMMP